MKRRSLSPRGLLLLIALDAMLLTACDKTPTRVQADDEHGPPLEADAASGLKPPTGGDGSRQSASPAPYGASAPATPASDGPPLIPGNAPPGAGPVGNGDEGVIVSSRQATVTVPAPPAPAMLNATEAQFFAQAAEAMIFEGRAAQIAADRAGDSAIKSYAAMLISDQPAMAGGLQQLAASLKIPLPVSLSLARQQTIDGLVQATPESFDRQFVQVAGSRAQQSTISLFEQAVREAQNPSIRDYANAALAILRAHLNSAQKLPIQG